VRGRVERHVNEVKYVAQSPQRQPFLVGLFTPRNHFSCKQARRRKNQKHKAHLQNPKHAQVKLFVLKAPDLPVPVKVKVGSEKTQTQNQVAGVLTVPQSELKLFIIH